MNRKKNRGFTLVEIMIVVLIIGILLAIAVPNFIKARESSRKQTCIGNLKQLDSGKEQYAMEWKLAQGDSIPGGGGPANLWPDYVKKQPTCPSGGTYAINNIGTDPTCTIAGHVLP